MTASQASSRAAPARERPLRQQCCVLLLVQYERKRKRPERPGWLPWLRAASSSSSQANRSFIYYYYYYPSLPWADEDGSWMDGPMEMRDAENREGDWERPGLRQTTTTPHGCPLPLGCMGIEIDR